MENAPLKKRNVNLAEETTETEIEEDTSSCGKGGSSETKTSYKKRSAMSMDQLREWSTKFHH